MRRFPNRGMERNGHSNAFGFSCGGAHVCAASVLATGRGQTGFPVLLDAGSEELNLWGMLDNK
jgi:hypothetical protein